MTADTGSYTFRRWHIPERMIPGLIRYRDHGVIPGHFLTALLENDFMGAMSRADDENLENLPAYANFIYNKMPIGCHGSPRAVKDWVEYHKKKREEEGE